MKRKLCALFCGLTMILAMVGCSTTTTIVDENYIERQAYGRFVVLSEQEYRTSRSFPHRQYITYDKDTKIMYIIDERGSYGFTITPFYVMDMNDEPVIGVYNGDLEDAE
jgi:hypothetical protein